MRLLFCDDVRARASSNNRPSAIKVAFCCEYDRYIYSPESDNAVPLASQENTATAEPKKSPV